MPVGSINHIATTTYRPTPLPRRLPLALAPTPLLPYRQCLLHHAANHLHPPTTITVHTLSLSKEEGEVGARPPPQILPTTTTQHIHPYPYSNSNSNIRTAHPTPTQPLPDIDTKQNYATTPPHHRGLPPGAATPPIPPYPRGPQQRWWSRLKVHHRC